MRSESGPWPRLASGAPHDLQTQQCRSPDPSAERTLGWRTGTRRPPNTTEPASVRDGSRFEGRNAMVGAFQVNRVLPRRVRRTVGSWCYRRPHEPGHGDSPERPGHRPHPHIGLQTITWLLQGEVLHRDSVGSEQVIRPGQLNLMTAGRGVSHSEETREVYEGDLYGLQLWVAQLTESRDGPAAFEHHAELPGFELENGNATVLVGELPGCASPARRDTDHVGVHLDLWSRASTVPLVAAHEYALAVLEGVISVGGQEFVPGQLGYLERILTADPPWAR